METKGRLIAGSRNRNEFVLINADEIARVTSVKETERANLPDLPCYEYERRRGTKPALNAKPDTSASKVSLFLLCYVGNPRVEGDEEEEDTDDLENEFDISATARSEPHHIADAMLTARLNIAWVHKPLFQVQPRAMDPKKDLAVYGYGTIAWKERMEERKKKQSEKLQVVKHQGEKDGGNNDGDEFDD
ncbi:hypothetical protein GH714_020256 [Hevea brasiliensis]|uniref:Uncharacterized protein n=1 Tax=Hevea brasiliensis TaxID=3981 RepID=A0A6A6KSV8_HEVBR|nr:hypothetical protein GH714_020256 [Hevea brasiliensis]